MEHLVFFLLNLGVLAIILIIDKANIKKYVLLLSIGLVLAFIFETVTIYLGFWHYHSQPNVPLISLYTWLLYAPYLSYCYYIGNLFGGKNEH
jgi:hypothetical protein